MPVPGANVRVGHMHQAIAAMGGHHSSSDPDPHHDPPRHGSHQPQTTALPSGESEAWLTMVDHSRIELPTGLGSLGTADAAADGIGSLEAALVPGTGTTEGNPSKSSLWKTRVAAAVERHRAETGNTRPTAPDDSNASMLWAQTISNLRASQQLASPNSKSGTKKRISFRPDENALDRHQRVLQKRTQSNLDVALRVSNRSGILNNLYSPLLTNDVANAADGDLLEVAVHPPGADKLSHPETLSRKSKDGGAAAFIVQGADPRFENPLFGEQKVPRLTDFPKLTRGTLSDNDERFHVPGCTVSITDYNATDLTENTFAGLENIKAALDAPRPSHSTVRWINVSGVDWPTLRVVTDKLSVHPLAVQDIMMNKRIKSNNYEDQFFLSLLFAAATPTPKTNTPIVSDSQVTSYDPPVSPSVAVPKDAKSATTPLLTTSSEYSSSAKPVTAPGAHGSAGKVGTPARTSVSHGSGHHSHAMFAAATQMMPSPTPAFTKVKEAAAAARETLNRRTDTMRSRSRSSTHHGEDIKRMSLVPDVGVALPSRVAEIVNTQGVTADLDEGSILDEIAEKNGFVAIVEQVSVLLFENGKLIGYDVRGLMLESPLA
ncbi:hypothetical protein HDU93_000049 [Gonapodya sp. JEL0774]|nr:hypothetical protein HDU93_000049 [Gonapodya sp. JEL0774]